MEDTPNDNGADTTGSLEDLAKKLGTAVVAAATDVLPGAQVIQKVDAGLEHESGLLHSVEEVADEILKLFHLTEGKQAVVSFVHKIIDVIAPLSTSK